MSRTGDSSGRKKSSTAAFLFLPQFGMCFEGLHYAGPIFMRTLAIMFVQAGLIPQNHPATRYGMEGVRKYGLSELLGDAWFNLRTTRTNPAQWGVFASVILMISIMIGTLVMAFTTISFGLGTEAYAQLFSLTTGGTAGTAVDTGTDNMPNFTADTGYTSSGGGCVVSSSGGSYGGGASGGSASGGSAMFDTCVPDATAGGHADYGIMILDKMLREGMLGQGAPLQNGMQLMMATYNSGILVVAGIMLFWAVLSVIVDTAKTGQIGGGRHNLVWAPIRIVFALGMLIPLGNYGFSSGQFLITKVAEWGSDFGTNVWDAYIVGVTASVVESAYTKNPTELVKAYTDMWICRVAYNAQNFQSVGASFIGSPQYVNISTMEGDATRDTWEAYFTNQVTGNLCGTIVYPYLQGNQAWLTATASTAGAELNPPAPPTAQGTACNGAMDLLACTIGMFKWEMAQAQSEMFLRNSSSTLPATGSSSGTGPPAGILDQYAAQFACAFVSQHIFDTGAAGSSSGGAAGANAGLDAGPLVDSGMCDGTESKPTAGSPGAGGIGAGGASFNTTPNNGFGNASGFADGGTNIDTSLTLSTTSCGGAMNTGKGPYPNDACIQTMVGTYTNAIQAVMNQGTLDLDAAFKTGMTATTTGSAATAPLLARGWADMGSWFFRILSLNAAADAMKDSMVSILPGTWITNAGAKSQAGNTNGVVMSNLDTMMMQIQDKDTEWWSQEPQRIAQEAQAGGYGMNGATTPVAITGGVNGQYVAPQSVPINCPPATNSGGANITGGPTQVAPSCTTVAAPVASPASTTTLGALTQPSNAQVNPRKSLYEKAMSIVSNVGEAIADAFVATIFGPMAAEKNMIASLLQPGSNNMYPYTQLVMIGQHMMGIGAGIIFDTFVLTGIASLVPPELGGGLVLDFWNSGLGHLVNLVSLGLLAQGFVLTYWVPFLPFVRVAFAVLTWMVYVFETVMLVPIAALTHISTEGEGFGHAKQAWLAWLHVLLRPALTVVGYVGSIMIFNTFIVYFNSAFQNVALGSATSGQLPIAAMLNVVAMPVIYVSTMYTMANICFKLLDIVPAKAMQYMGGHGVGHSFNEEHGATQAMMTAAGSGIGQMSTAMSGAGAKFGKGLKELGGGGGGSGGGGGGDTGGGGVTTESEEDTVPKKGFLDTMKEYT